MTHTFVGSGQDDTYSMLRNMLKLSPSFLDQNVLTEQIQILYRTLLPILAVNLVVSAALLFGLWKVVPQSQLNIWMSLMVLLIAVRAATYFVYRRNVDSAQTRRYGTYFVIGTGLTGLLWGISGVMLFPSNELNYQLLILFVLVGMGAGSVSSLTVYLPAFFAYFPVSMLPVAIVLFMQGDSIHLALGVMTIAYIIAISYFGINLNRSLVQSLRLRFENMELVEQLRQQKDEAEHANLSKTKFLAAASHDLRQPLHALTLFTSVLDESITYPKVRRVVDQINASVHALQSLFNALLDISRLEAGVMKVEKEIFSLQPVFEKLANDFNPQAQEKGLKIYWPDAEYTVHSDPTLLEQILRNYVANAIRYTDSGEVRIECETHKNQLTIHVKDTGAGIPEEECEAIFGEFHQLNNPERDRSKGLGLGLAIVERTANLLNHPIGVDSRPGKGSDFYITVELLTKSRILKKVTAGNIDHALTAKKTLIMVIDDEVSVREGTQALLETWGCDVICAADAEDALVLFRQSKQTPHGIIADYRLPEKQTGIDTIQAIFSEHHIEIPAIIVTGDIAAEQLREVNSSGFQVLHKPVAPVKLRAFVQHCQSQHRKAQH